MAQRPIESRTHSVEQEGLGDSITVEGGRRLKGKVTLQGTKNLALQAIPIAMLAEGEVTYTNFPRIRDVEINLAIAESMGAKITWKDSGVISIDSTGLNPVDIDPLIAVRTTGSRYHIPVLVRRSGRLVTGPSGGDRIGGADRYGLDDETLRVYRQMGIESREISQANGVKKYEFWEAEGDLGFLRLDQRYFGPTVQAILSHALSRNGEEFTIYKPSIEPEIFETIKLLNAMGANIAYEQKGRQEGEDFILIKGQKSLGGAKFRIMSDPNVLASYAVAALITDGEVLIEGIDRNDKVDAFLEILYEIGAIFDYNSEGGKLLILPSLSRLKPVSLKTDFWPAACHTDWQQILTPLLAILGGDSFIDENVYPERFENRHALSLMGGRLELIDDPTRISNARFRIDGLRHTLKINGPVNFHGANVEVPQDVRGATSVLLAALSAKGTSVIRGVSQIERGLENYQEVLRSLEAEIKAQ